MKTIKAKEGSSTFLLKVYDTDDDCVRCNYAIVTITKNLMDVISKLRKGRDNMGCYEVTDFNYSCRFLNQDEWAFQNDEKNIPEELVDELDEFTQDNKGVWQIEPVGELPEIITDADTIHVSQFGVKFTAYMKHTEGVRFSTEKISFEKLDKLKM